MKVSPVEAVIRFNVRNKLSPRYIRPYEIIEKLNPMGYRLDLLAELKHMHNVFHISQPRKYVRDQNHIIIIEPIKMAKNLVCKERPMQILDYRVKQLQNKRIHLVKVLCANHTSSEVTLETKEDMRNKYITI